MKKTYTFYSLVIASIILFGFAPFGSFNYKSEAGKYKIDFPAKPEESSQDVQTAVGKVTMYMAIHDASKDDDAPNLVYLTSYVDYDSLDFDTMSDEKLDGFYDGSLNGSISNVKGKLITKSPFMLNGKRGIQADVDFQNGMAVIRMKYLLVKNRLYMLETVTETSKLDNPVQKHFFDSFGLTD